MADGINLSVVKTGSTKGEDVTQFVDEITWGGRKGSSSRYLEVSFLDDEERSSRVNVDVEKGYNCLFTYNGVELFRGIFMKNTSTEKKKLKLKAYDNGIYLANNKDTFTYTNATVGDVFKDVCSRYGLRYSECTFASYRIPDLTKNKTTAWDVLCDAMSQVYNATGVRHYIDSEKGYLRLCERREKMMQWVLEVGENIISYNNSVSIEKVKTRIKLLSDEGTVLAEKRDSALETAIGIMQDIDTPDDTLNAAQLENLVSGMLREKSKAERSLKLDTLGLPDVTSGAAVFVVIPSLGIRKTFYVDEDKHTFKDRFHKMTVTLNLANDSEYKKDYTATQQGSTGGRNIGDIVNFAGGYHYYTSLDSTPRGGWRTGGPARIENIAPNAPHKYALIGGAWTNCGGNSNVYGWVDESTVS